MSLSVRQQSKVVVISCRNREHSVKNEFASRVGKRFCADFIGGHIEQSNEVVGG